MSDDLVARLRMPKKAGRLAVVWLQQEAADRIEALEVQLAAMQDPAALTVAYLAGVESERDRAKIASEGP